MTTPEARTRIDAARSVKDMIDNGYRVLFETRISNHEYMTKLRHSSNGNIARVLVDGCTWELWVNGQQRKKVTTKV